MKIYEIKSNFVDDYFVQHNYSIGIFKKKVNAEKRLKEIKEEKNSKYALYVDNLKIIERETED